MDFRENYLILGSPGSGKGTLCQVLKEQGYQVFSMGEKLRQEVRERTALGKKVEENIAKGILIPDDLAFSIFKKEMRGVGKFAIEGFPSTINQYKLFLGLDFLKNLTVIYLECSEKKALERILNRLTCRECAAIYNISTKSPKQAGKCDLCGGILFQRSEDTLSCAKKRLQSFRKETLPILSLAKENFPFLTIPQNEDGAVL